jgi:zinc/manganese transport system substrate-binding protein
MKKFLIVFLVLAVPMHASALEFFACEPEWAALLKELAGSDIEVTIGTTAFQDPHVVQARPSLIAAVRNADLVVCSGADLEIGWLPLLLRRSGNPDIQVGSPGYFLAANYVRLLEVPKVVDRSQGDVHPQGNPHIHLHPRNISRIADALAERLGEIDPSNSASYDERLDDFQERWDVATDEWEQRAESLEGLRLTSHHLSFSYLVDWLDLDIVATLEAKPGIPPSGAQLASLLERLAPNPPAGVIRTPYENERPSTWLSDRLDIPAIVLPYTIGGAEGVEDLFSLYDVSIRMLAEYAE